MSEELRPPFPVVAGPELDAINERRRQAGLLPIVPYTEPPPWVPSGGFGEFRSPEEQAADAEHAAVRERETSRNVTEADSEETRRALAESESEPGV